LYGKRFWFTKDTDNVAPEKPTVAVSVDTEAVANEAGVKPDKDVVVY
jgi:hypothetical protein